MGPGFDSGIDFEWGGNNGPDDYFDLPRSVRNQRYSNAYGSYRGGYGPPGGFGPPRGFGPPPPAMFPGPPGPPGPGFMWGRGFGPNGPPGPRKYPKDDKAVRYLMRCGVAKEHLRNLPKDLLQLIQPQYCGLCAQHLMTFAVSRTHYISKNHLKNQKKWLSQRYEAGFQRPKEVPLKSRELYCELCDVHITSKNHADSHYAGKPHRAIVEGRKMPRNPILLQKQMKDRLEQLIRREKKNLKPADEKPEEEAQSSKPAEGELYCDICKTSVTCSDQMTMHLNGKKHLTKEKRHIFEMMKGQGKNPDEGNTSSAGAEAAGDTSVATEDGDDIADDEPEGGDEEEGDGNENGGNGNGDAGEQDGEEDWPSGEHDL